MDNDTMQPESIDVREPRYGEIKKTFKINTRIVVVLVAVIVMVALIYMYRGLFIAAMVDGAPISRLAVIQKLETISGKGLLDSLIVEKLIQNEAALKKIIINGEEVDAEIKKIEDQVKAQGGTIDMALASQGMTIDDLKTNIILQKEVEKLVEDKINVTDQEVAQYIEDNQVSVTNGQEAAINEQIKNELRGQKLGTESQNLISDLKSKARIQYFVNY